MSEMVAIVKNHYRCYAAAQLVSNIIFSKEFAALKEELYSIYCRNNIENAEKEAFQDSLYSFLTQEQGKLKAVSFIPLALAESNIGFSS